MNRNPSKFEFSARKFSRARPISLFSLLSFSLFSIVLLVSRPVGAEPVAVDQIAIEPEALTWARVDFIRNRVQLVPQQQRGRRARISDILSVGDSLRTARASRAELRFNDGSLARIGERATFRFTPNTRNFQLSNGTVLLLIPPGRGRSTIQTPNAVTGIQGSALFVRYIPETDTTIVGALTDNAEGPMVLFNRDGTEQQALRANEIGVIEGDQITELYQFDGALFWQSSGLAEGFNYLTDSSSTGSDALDGVRQEIRDALASQRPLNNEGVITNPDSFSRPDSDEPPTTPGVTPSVGPSTGSASPSTSEMTTTPGSQGVDSDLELDNTEEPALEFQDSPAQEYLQGDNGPLNEEELGIGVNNSLTPSEPQNTANNPSTDAETDETLGSEEPAPTEPDGSENTPTLPTPDDDGEALIADPTTNPTVISGPGTEGSADEDGNPTVQPLAPAALTDSPDDGETPDEPPSEIPNEVPVETPDDSGNAVDNPVNDSAGDVPGSGLDNGASENPSDIPSETPSDIPSETPSDIPGEAPSENPAEPLAPPTDDVPGAPDGIPGDTPSGIPDVPPDPTDNPIIPEPNNPSGDTPNDIINDGGAPTGSSSLAPILPEGPVLPEGPILPETEAGLEAAQLVGETPVDITDGSTLQPLPAELEGFDDRPAANTIDSMDMSGMNTSQ
ncbi:MAG: FecR domain-containing protein [Cyanobacteria bacterium J06632_3]